MKIKYLYFLAFLLAALTWAAGECAAQDGRVIRTIVLGKSNMRIDINGVTRGYTNDDGIWTGRFIPAPGGVRVYATGHGWVLTERSVEIDETRSETWNFTSRVEEDLGPVTCGLSKLNCRLRLDDHLENLKARSLVGRCGVTTSHLEEYSKKIRVDYVERLHLRTAIAEIYLMCGREAQKKDRDNWFALALMELKRLEREPAVCPDIRLARLASEIYTLNKPGEALSYFKAKYAQCEKPDFLAELLFLYLAESGDFAGCEALIQQVESDELKSLFRFWHDVEKGDSHCNGTTLKIYQPAPTDPFCKALDPQYCNARMAMYFSSCGDKRKRADFLTANKYYSELYRAAIEEEDFEKRLLEQERLLLMNATLKYFWAISESLAGREARAIDILARLLSRADLDHETHERIYSALANMFDAGTPKTVAKSKALKGIFKEASEPVPLVHFPLASATFLNNVVAFFYFHGAIEPNTARKLFYDVFDMAWTSGGDGVVVARTANCNAEKIEAATSSLNGKARDLEMEALNRVCEKDLAAFKDKNVNLKLVLLDVGITDPFIVKYRDGLVDGIVTSSSQ